MTSRRREVAVIPHDTKLFAVHVRERGWWGGWRDWKTCVTQSRTYAWPYERARALADQALVHGWVPGVYASEVYPIIELDEGEAL